MSKSTKSSSPAGGKPVRFPRGRRTGWSATIAILLLAIAVIVGYLAVLQASNRTVRGVDLAAASRWLRNTDFSGGAVLVTGIAVAAVGVVLIAVAMLPTPRHLVELAGPDEHTAAALPKSSLRRTVQSAAVKIDGIARARARIGGRTVRLDVTSGLRHTDWLTATADTAATGRLLALGLRRPRTVKTRLSRRER